MSSKRVYFNRKIDEDLRVFRVAIDFVQEHVLKEGPQNNESAIEQAKDKKIADTIRAAIGHPKK